MTTRRLLLFAPGLLILVLLQSYFWVPTYEEQTRGNPDRLEEFIAASIGDASLLNPILSADSASSQIEGLVYEGLLDRDEDLRFRGRIAGSWEISEEAFFWVNEEALVPGLGRLGPEEVLGLLRRMRDAPPSDPRELGDTLREVREVALLPPETRTVTRPRKTRSGEEALAVRLTVKIPWRIKLTLSGVDQDLFENLSLLLGSAYFSARDPGEHVEAEPEISGGELAALAGDLVSPMEHNPVIVFRLREGVRFHDGEPLDAADVTFTYQAIMDPRNLSPRIGDYEPVKTVEAVDPLTVRVTYKRLYSPALGTWGIGILPEHLLNREALGREALQKHKDPDTFSIRDSAFNRRPVGSGPFVFREWKADQYIALSRFEGYWEGPPNYGRYLFRIVPDLLTQEMEFYAGTIDSYTLQPHQVARLEKDPRFQSFSGTSFGYTYIGYNLRRKPFDDPRVRRALGMAIDVEKILRYVLYGQGERITGPFAKQTDFYNHALPPLPYDPKGALRLLAEAGWRPGPEGWLEKEGKRLSFTLITNSGNDIRKAILAIAQDSWKQIGIEVRTDILEWSVFIQERVNKTDFDALILGWVMGIEPDLFQIWHSSQTHPHQLNFVGFKNAEADHLILKIRQEYDHARQVAYCHRLHEIIAEEQPYTFLYVGKWTAILDRRIVIRRTGEDAVPRYERIKPTKTGSYTFHFNQWIKVPEFPDLEPEG